MLLLRNSVTFFEFGFSLACLSLISVDINFWLLERKNASAKRQKIVRENKWGRGDYISVLCVYSLVAICILAAPFLKMIYHRKLDKFADTNVCGGAS